MEALNLEEALLALTDIRRSIDRVNNPRPSRTSLHARFVILASAATGAACFLLAECLNHRVTNGLLRSQVSPELRINGLTTIGLALFLAVTIIFCIFQFHARQAEQHPKAFVDRYFPQLALLAFSSDLLVKYAALAAVILALRPHFVAPLLLVFIGDYLLQGRIFELPFRLSILAAACTLLLAAAQFSSGDPSVLLPLGIFTAMALLSAMRTRAELRQVAQG